jgi:hypothetical protein
MKAVLIVTIALAIGAAAVLAPANAQVQRFNEDYSGNQESGPPIVPGGGATAGPNSKNAATVPIPGMEQLSERPKEATLPVPETPIVLPRPTRSPTTTKTPQRVQQ